MKKWKLLFVNGCKCKSLISTMAEILNLYQDRTNASMRSRIVLKNDDILVE
jgi:hypothetical protein